MLVTKQWRSYDLQKWVDFWKIQLTKNERLSIVAVCIRHYINISINTYKCIFPPLFVPFIGIYHVYDNCYSFTIVRKPTMSKDIVLKTYCTQYIQYNIFMIATVALWCCLLNNISSQMEDLFLLFIQVTCLSTGKGARDNVV